jgi:hypothetical protein
MVMNDFFEKTLEDIVFEKRDTVHERGLDIFYKNAERQFYVSGKKIDILTWEISDDIFYARIIEFKRDQLSDSAYFQAVDYYAELCAAIFGYFKDFHIEIVLIGTKSSVNIKNAVCVSNLISIYEYHYSFDGVCFNKVGHSFDNVKNLFHSIPADDDKVGLINKLKDNKG